jgi:hypothetical protein
MGEQQHSSCRAASLSKLSTQLFRLTCMQSGPPVPKLPSCTLTKAVRREGAQKKTILKESKVSLNTMQE